MRRRGLTKEDISDLKESIPSRDVIAEKQQKPIYHGRIEEIEDAMFPWLKARRRARRPR